MARLGATGFCAILTILLTTTASSQQVQTRNGFWIGAGMGYGSMGIGCDGCAGSDREGASSGYVKLGTTFRQNILLGVEADAWTNSAAGERRTMGNISGAVYWYPMVANGLFLKSGIGYSMFDSNLTYPTFGFGVLGGVGYDVRVSRNLSITPVANWFRGSFDGGSADVLQIGLGITSH